MSNLSSAEKGVNSVPSIEKGKLIVSQPQKLTELNELLMSLENLDRRVSEVTGEDRSGDLGGAGSASQSQGGQGPSPRDIAIANIPAAPVMQRKLTQHIVTEMGELRSLAHKTVRAGKAGNAYKLNRIYARIRRLQSLMSELVDASLELLKKLYVRVFVDKQPIL